MNKICLKDSLPGTSRIWGSVAYRCTGLTPMATCRLGSRSSCLLPLPRAEEENGWSPQQQAGTQPTLPLGTRRDKQQGAGGKKLFLPRVTPLFPPLPHRQTFPPSSSGNNSTSLPLLPPSSRDPRGSRERLATAELPGVLEQVHVCTHAGVVSKKGLQITIWPLELPRLDDPEICRSNAAVSSPRHFPRPFGTTIATQLSYFAQLSQ